MLSCHQLIPDLVSLLHSMIIPEFLYSMLHKRDRKHRRTTAASFCLKKIPKTLVKSKLSVALLRFQWALMPHYLLSLLERFRGLTFTANGGKRDLCEVTKYSLYSKNNGPVWQSFQCLFLVH